MFVSNISLAEIAFGDLHYQRS